MKNKPGLIAASIVLLFVGVSFFVVEFCFPQLYRDFMGLVVPHNGRMMTANTMKMYLLWSRMLPILCLLLGLVLLLCSRIISKFGKKVNKS